MTLEPGPVPSSRGSPVLALSDRFAGGWGAPCCPPMSPPPPHPQATVWTPPPPPPFFPPPVLCSLSDDALEGVQKGWKTSSLPPLHGRFPPLLTRLSPVLPSSEAIEPLLVGVVSYDVPTFTLLLPSLDKSAVTRYPGLVPRGLG